MERYFKLLLPAIANSVGVCPFHFFAFTGEAPSLPAAEKWRSRQPSLDPIKNAIPLFRVTPPSWKLIHLTYSRLELSRYIT